MCSCVGLGLGLGNRVLGLGIGFREWVPIRNIIGGAAGAHIPMTLGLPLSACIGGVVAHEVFVFIIYYASKNVVYNVNTSLWVGIISGKGTERRNGTTASRSGFYKNMIIYATERRNAL